MIVGDMGFPIHTQHLTCVDHGHGIKKKIALPLIKADRDHQLQLFCQFPEMKHRLIFHHRLRIMVIPVFSLLTEIGPLKQFRQQDNLRPLCGRLPRHLIRLCDIFLCFLCAAKLQRRQLYFSHTVSPAFPGICCVMQWMLPPPSRISLA